MLSYHERLERSSAAINKELLNCVLLGKLADENERLPNIGKENKAVTINFKQEDRVNIYLQVLTSEPQLIQDTGKQDRDCYISFDDKNLSFLRKIKYYDQDDRVGFLREYLAGKLILFRPKLSERENNMYHYNFELLHVSGDVVKDSYYFPVPSVSPDLSTARFEKILLDKSQPFKLPSYPSVMEVPEFIICEKYLYHIEDPTALSTSPTNKNIYYCTLPEKIRRIQLPEEWESELQGAMDGLAFIRRAYGTALRDSFEKHGEPIGVKADTQRQEREEPAIGAEALAKEELPEHLFIQKLKYLAQREGLTYEESDLINFHTAMKTGMLTILGGMSGTGKTRLALLYAEALDLKNQDNLLILPISPSYTEPSDLLGHLNQQIGIYMESETGLVSFLQKAAEEQNKDCLFMIIFDEMNLGQVEHYFSPFISLLEMDEEDRLLTLFSARSICRDGMKPRIPIGKNVLFVGTANFDETTKDFSKRLLDRTNLIQLDKGGFLDAKNQVPSTEEPAAQVMSASIGATLYRDTWIKPVKGFQFLETEELQLLEQIHRLMRSIDAQTGVSFRIANGISRFLYNIPRDKQGDEFLARKRALDYQIKQRLLSKIRGYRDQIVHLVGTYDFEREKFEPGELASLLNSEEWELHSSYKYLEQKAKELTRNGYTL